MHSARLRGSTMHIRRGRAPRHSAITLSDRDRSSIANGPVEDAQGASDRLRWCRGPSADLSIGTHDETHDGVVIGFGATVLAAAILRTAV